MPLMHLLTQPWIWGQPGGQQPGPGGVQGCPCKACSLLCGTWRPHFPWLGRSQALGKVSPKSQLSDSHSCTNSEHASQPSACFSKSASPNVQREQEESVSLPRGENSCQAVPRGAASLWWHNGRTQPVQLSLFPVQGGSVSTAAAGSPVLSLAASLEKGWQKRGKIRDASVHAEGAGTAQRSLAAWLWVGRQLGALSKSHSLGSPHYLR